MRPRWRKNSTSSADTDASSPAITIRRAMALIHMAALVTPSWHNPLASCGQGRHWSLTNPCQTLCSGQSKSRGTRRISLPMPLTLPPPREGSALPDHAILSRRFRLEVAEINQRVERLGGNPAHLAPVALVEFAVAGVADGLERVVLHGLHLALGGVEQPRHGLR